MPVYRGTVVITGAPLGGTGTNTWHARTDGIADAGDATLQGLTDALEDFYAAIDQVHPSGINRSFDGTWVRVDGDEETIIDTNGWSHGVLTGGSPLPPQECLVIGWRTTNASRRGRGRTFIGPLNTGCLEANGTPDEGRRAVVEGAAAALVDAFDGIGNGALCIWSEADQVGRDLVSGSVRNVFGSLRSRRD